VTGVIAVLGFGEAGSLIARDLVAAGAAVRGFDPQGPAPAGVTAADRVAATLRGYGASIEVLDGPAGLAATRKLLRSVFYKGMASSIVEALEAARAAGLEDWLRPHIAGELAKADASTVERIAAGTRQHAVRRGHEMAAAAEMLTDLGVEPIMADASRALHERLAAGENRPPSG
jgi:3-hydroxyisobutyrate dehydrogenase-like beta-hydroxyacid dehydrogenase